MQVISSYEIEYMYITENILLRNFVYYEFWILVSRLFLCRFLSCEF